jgi:hypothetical protein
MTYSGQAITVNAAHFSSVSNATMTYAGQAASTVQVKAVIAAAMTYAAQAIATNAKRFSALANATMTYTGQAIVSSQRTISAIGNSTMAYIGQAIHGTAEVAITWLGNQLGLREKD